MIAACAFNDQEAACNPASLHGRRSGTCYKSLWMNPGGEAAIAELFALATCGLALAALGASLGKLRQRLHLPRTSWTVGGTAASHCPRCQQPVAWFDNVPVLLGFPRGAAAAVRPAIGWRYPLFSYLAAILAMAVYARFVLGQPTPLPPMLARFLIYFFLPACSPSFRRLILSIS